MISGFSCNVNEISTLLRCYTATTGSSQCFETNYQFHLRGSSSPRDVSSLLLLLLLYAAQHHRRMKISSGNPLKQFTPQTFQLWRHTKTEQVQPLNVALLSCFLTIWTLPSEYGPTPPLNQYTNYKTYVSVHFQVLSHINSENVGLKVHQTFGIQHTMQLNPESQSYIWYGICQQHRNLM